MRVILIIILFALASSSIYTRYYAQSLKIAQAMTLDQKIGQTIQADFYAITQKNITDPALATSYALGSLLVGGNGAPTVTGDMADIPGLIQEEKIKNLYLNASNQNWLTLTQKFANIGPQITTTDKKTYKIKLLLGTDAVHNNQHVVGTILFPHNIGLSCTHNPQNFYNVGYWTGLNVKNSGFNFAFAPTVAVSHNPQWGRYYQTMGQESDYIFQYGKQFVRGIQNVDVANGKLNGVLASVKHFFGDGSTLYGANQGDARTYNFSTYIQHNIQGYKGAIESEVGNVMCSYSAINDIPMAINSYYLQGLLREDIKFDGFVISDWDEMNRISDQQLPTSFVNMTDEQAMSTMMNAGIDMFMVPQPKNHIDRYIKNTKKSLNDSSLFLDRIEDAVAKILSVKFAMGLVQVVNTQESPKNIRVQEELRQLKQNFGPKFTTQYADSLKAVRQSLVLLKNDNNLLPVRSLASTIKYVVLVGQRTLNINRLTKIQLFRSFDNIGMQSGGWSVRWQGFQGNDFWADANKASSNASSILDALSVIKQRNNFTFVYPNYSNINSEVTIALERQQYISQLTNTIRKDMNSRNTIIIGVVGQSPYAQTDGDVNIPYCQDFSQDTQPGCKYPTGLNPYLKATQSNTLEVDYTNFDEDVIDTVRGADKNIPLISVLLSGRPVPINNVLNISNSVIAAWLPGTSGGQGIVDAIYGDYIIRPGGTTTRVNSLSMDWPTDMNSLKLFPIYRSQGEIPAITNPLFTVGYGLSTGSGSNQVQE